MQQEMHFEGDDDFVYPTTPATFNPISKAMRLAEPVDMRNAHIRFAVLRGLHGTDQRNKREADRELFRIAAKFIEGDY